jgi:hypothetical protein
MFYLASFPLAAAFLLETSILGNAFSHYLSLPRWAGVFTLIFVSIALAGIRSLPKVDQGTLFLVVVFGAFFVLDIGFGLSHALYAAKVMLLLLFFVLAKRSKEILALSAKLMLLVFNVALVVTCMNFLLPDSLLLEPSFLTELRRFDAGDGYKPLYSMYNFGGLIMSGDNFVSFAGYNFPRYSGYFTEPSTYIFSYLAVAIISAASFGLGRIGKLFLVINLLGTFSVTAALIVAAFLSAKLWQSRFRAVVIFSLPALLMFFLVFAFGHVAPSADNYLARKFSGSGGITLSLWLDGLQQANLAGTSSFNARIGNFDIQNISIISLIYAYALFGTILASFIKKGLQFAVHPDNANLLSLIALTIILTFIAKAPNHALFSWFSIALLFFFGNVHTRFPAGKPQSGLTA